MTLKATCLVLALLASPLAAQARPFPFEPTKIFLKYAVFDPLEGEPAVPAPLRAGPESRLWIVQFDQAPTDGLRRAVAEAGGDLTWYQPEYAYIVRMAPQAAERVRHLDGVRWVGAFHPAYRLEAFLLAELAAGVDAPARKYNIVVVDRAGDKPALGAAIRGLGGEVTHAQPGSILFEVRLDQALLLAAARLDQVLWIDRWSPPEEDMNNARIQGGGNYVESVGGYTGKGVNGHIYEGLDIAHTDFTIRPTNVLSAGGADTHGHCTAGIVFGNGTSHPDARGMAPDAKPFFTQYSTVTSGYSRYQVIGELVTKHDVMFTTASWGGTQVTTYTSTSADTDTIIFDHDIPWTNSQSNTGSTLSRPEAWAKNIFSIGGVVHRDNANRKDDSWAAGGGSTGPAADGRIKPDLCAYYDAILCSDRTGTAGYATGSYYTGFGGTSGATPICAGHNALALQMFTDHIFNNSPKVPGGTRFQNRPHFTTLKALMIANARQYAFNASSTDNRREHQGWGFPDLKTMHANRTRMFLVDETDVLAQGNKKSYPITVQAGDPELKIVLTFADPAAAPNATITRINDLDLKVTAPDNTVYWGNYGLTSGNYSLPGGARDSRDTVECVLINQPGPGVWTVEVAATLVAQDAHKETPAVDADFALCVSFGTLNSDGVIAPFGKGCPGTGKLPSSCVSANPNGGTLVRNLRSYIYAYPVSAPQALQVEGFRIWTAASSGTPTVTTYLYPASGSVPAASPMATSSMQVGTQEGFYETRFTPPVSIAQGTLFFLGVAHANVVYLSSLQSGTTSTCYANTSGWTVSTIATRPSWHVLCPGGAGATPSLQVTGSAEIGTTLNCALSQAAPSSAALLMLGDSNTLWGAAPLPYSLGIHGAPGCDLLVALNLYTATAVGSGGTGQVLLAIPNNTALVRNSIFSQALVVDPGANPLGVALTGGVKVTIGN